MFILELSIAVGEQMQQGKPASRLFAMCVLHNHRRGLHVLWICVCQL